MTFHRILEVYDEGLITPLEAAHALLRLTAKDNVDVAKTEFDRRPDLEKTITQVVNDFKNLTDDQWNQVLTFQSGAYTRPFTPEEEEIRKQRHQEEHRALRRGVEAMSNGL